MATNACHSEKTNAASMTIQPCEIALAEHNGNQKVDNEIRQTQQKIRANEHSQQSLPLIEKLDAAQVRLAFMPALGCGRNFGHIQLPMYLA